MIICKVIGSVWATRKEESLNGIKLMIVTRLDPKDTARKDGLETFVAADFVGAGVNDKVIVATGSSARLACRNTEPPVDATIVGIIDELEVSDAIE